MRELEVYCRWHRLWVPKAHSAELPRDEPINILARLEKENNQMQRWLDQFHAIQKAWKHLHGKSQEITSLDNDKDISDFIDSSNDDFQEISTYKD